MSAQAATPRPAWAADFDPARERRRRWVAAVLLRLAVFALPVILIVIPFVAFLGYSLFSVEGTEIKTELTAENYIRIFAEPVFLTVFAKTIALCLGVAALTTAVGYPVAYFLSLLSGRMRSLLLIAISVPLVLSYVMKLYAMRGILGGRGLLNRALMAIGLIDQPTDLFVFNLNAVFLVLAVLLVPFAILPVYLALEAIPASFKEASADLGASRIRTFVAVILPLSLPGVAGAFSLTFVMAIGDFITPQMVGGPNGLTLGRVIYSQFGLAYNWPFGAALGVLLMLVVVVVLSLAAVLARPRGRA